MKTLLDIDDELMAQLLQAAGTTVKKKAVVTAIESFLEMKKHEKLADLIGAYEFAYTQKELEQMRADGQGHH
ncbi:MAG: type II toxin-antitoxin system VapB family antitoxin [Desulfobacterales bacterium]|nr:type II toxin-antitoxin system VapB family antitoxin [Desulfobacterales bacterium]